MIRRLREDGEEALGQEIAAAAATAQTADRNNIAGAY
jgi:hypothetical protein